MHIMTATGWRPLLTQTATRIAEAPPRYRGRLPSADCDHFVSELEKAHQEWVALRASLFDDAEAA